MPDTSQSESTTSIDNWSGGKAQALYTDPTHEPSGLAFIDYDNETYLYMVSDDGYIFRRQSGTNDWNQDQFGDDDAHDFESVTEVGGNLMIGIEGGVEQGTNTGVYSSPIVQRYDPGKSSNHELGDFTGSSWTLNGMPIDANGGMEGLTFVPDGSGPSTWQDSSHYGGLFLAAVQSSTGTIYVYDLVSGGGTAHDVDAPLYTITTPLLDLKISDMHFDQTNERLIVLYDDAANDDYSGNGGSDYVGLLQVLEVDGDGWSETMLMRTQYVGCEAVTYANGNLYIGLDQSGSKSSPTSQWGVNGLSDNYVLKYKDFSLD
jgi:hypothetical protein